MGVVEDAIACKGVAVVGEARPHRGVEEVLKSRLGDVWPFGRDQIVRLL